MKCFKDNMVIQPSYRKSEVKCCLNKIFPFVAKSGTAEKILQQLVDNEGYSLRMQRSNFPPHL